MITVIKKPSVQDIKENITHHPGDTIDILEAFENDMVIYLPYYIVKKLCRSGFIKEEE